MADRDPDIGRWIRQVRNDLTDGEDLALASKLVNDVLARRARRARHTLIDVRQHVEGEGTFGDAEELIEHIEVLERRTAEFEEEMRNMADRIRTTVEAYEAELAELADDVEGLTEG